MNENDYQEAVFACALARSIVANHDLQAVLDAIEHAHALGPIVDPSAYRERARAMDEDRELVRAALVLARVGKAVPR